MLFKGLQKAEQREDFSLCSAFYTFLYFQLFCSFYLILFYFVFSYFVSFLFCFFLSAIL